jgi:RNA polymerase sigma-70 factor (ECF subfamily)
MNYESMSIDELVQECAKSSHADAWAEFIRRFQRLIASVVIRCCHEWSETSQEVIEDLIQDTYLKLCANNRSLLANFRSEHPNSFLGYLKTVTANLAYDHFRALIGPMRDREKTVGLDEANNQAKMGFGGAEATEDEVFFKEVDGILLARGSGPLQQKERTIFWLRYRQGFTAKEIASLPDIDLEPKGVESAIYRVTEFVKRVLVEKQGKKPAKGFPAAEPF